MAVRSVLTTLALAAFLAAPAGAQERERRRPNQNDNNNNSQSEQSAPEQRTRARGDAAARDRAIPRSQPREEAQAPQAQAPRADLSRQEQARAADQRRADDNRRDNNNRRNDDNRRYDNNYRYDTRGYAYGTRRYDTRNRYYYYFPAPRVIHPTVIHVVPYRPYVYHPSFSLGVYYGSGGYYPYGYTPRGYYEPIPGRPYGGVRITGAPRDARVFADGYFVGIVDDFDGIFQHINLEAGPHHIEVEWGGYQPIAFDVYVRPGETTTFRADRY
jgi:PEGA domain